jgi:hypothetical protein
MVVAGPPVSGDSPPRWVIGLGRKGSVPGRPVHSERGSGGMDRVARGLECRAEATSLTLRSFSQNPARRVYGEGEAPSKPLPQRGSDGASPWRGEKLVWTRRNTHPGSVDHPGWLGSKSARPTSPQEGLLRGPGGSAGTAGSTPATRWSGRNKTRKTRQAIRSCPDQLFTAPASPSQESEPADIM